VLNAESCEETMLNQAFTRTGVANSSCHIIPGLDHLTVECTGTNGTALAHMWGIFNTQCDPDFAAPTRNFTMYAGCNVMIGGSLVSAFLEGGWNCHRVGAGWHRSHTIGRSIAIDPTAIDRSIVWLAHIDHFPYTHMCNTTGCPTGKSKKGGK
jgi:hypothetical protein